MEYNYATEFQQQLQKKYAKELCSDELTKSNQQVKFINAETIKLPSITVSGYKDHTRTIGFNAGTLSNDWTPKKLSFDRDIEFFIDPMDMDETNLTLSVANIQNTFEEEQAIPEKDCYRFSKLHSELQTLSGRIDKTVIDAATFLEWFDGERQNPLCNTDYEKDCKRGRRHPEGNECNNSDNNQPYSTFYGQCHNQNGTGGKNEDSIRFYRRVQACIRSKTDKCDPDSYILCGVQG